MAPQRKLAIVACMDSRMDIFETLRLANGEAHVIRNAGGVITDDVIRSLCLSQRKLGTREVNLLHHTDCGLQTVTEDAFKAELESELESSHGGRSNRSPTRTPTRCSHAAPSNHTVRAPQRACARIRVRRRHRTAARGVDRRFDLTPAPSNRGFEWHSPTVP